MYAKFGIILIITVIFSLLAACSASPTLTPELEDLIIKVQVSPSVTHLLDKLNACAESQGTNKLSANIVPSQIMNPVDFDLTIRLGVKKTTDEFISVLGYEEIILITNPENPVLSISKEDLKQVLIGELIDWQEIQAGYPGTNYDYPITVFSYSPNNEMHQWLIEDVLLIDSEQLRVTLVGSQDKMIEQVANTKGSIGYILRSQINNQVKELSFNSEEKQNLTVPVLAVTNQDPNNELLSLLLCLQN